MPKKQTIIEEAQYLSDRLSTQVRTIALGLLAVTWGLLIGESHVAVAIAVKLKMHLIGIGAIAIFTMCFDFLQYFFGYLDSRALIKKMEAKKIDELKFRPSSCWYKLRSSFFVVKQVSLGIGVGWFIGTLVWYFLK